MSIHIKNYQSRTGMTLKNAYLSVSQLTYYPRTKMLTFLADIYAEDRATVAPAEMNVISGQFTINDEDEDVDSVQLIEDAIEDKIEAVKGKTQQECDDHNATATSWLDLWELDYLRYASDESSEDEDDDEEYIEAARILLEGE